MSPILKQLPSGRMVDLMRPDASRLDGEFWAIDVPVGLARIARFGGAAGCPLTLRHWSVLDHVVVGADELHGFGQRIQLLFLLHDVHEAIIGDIPTPSAAAIAATVRTLCGEETPSAMDGGHATRAAISVLKNEWDKAIFAAAGVALPTPDEARIIHTHDLRMMMTERRDLMAGRQAWPGLEHIKPLPRPLTDKKGQWPQPHRRIEAFLERLDAWAPHARRRAPLADFEQAARSLGYDTETVR
jgi:hypothetical protein